MTPARLSDRLEAVAPGAWELYEKRAVSHETAASGSLRGVCERREEGWAARFWLGGAPRFAAASSPEGLERAIDDAQRLATAPEAPPEWPTAARPAALPQGEAVEPPAAETFDELGRLLSAESRGEALLTELSIRRGIVEERIVNARGGDVAFQTRRLSGVALAVGRRGARACEARVVFRADGELDLPALARRLADRATLPLSDQGTPFPRGEWLLDPCVGAALLAAVAPLFTAANLPSWVARSRFTAEPVTLVDDATADAPYDGEGVATRRTVLVTQGRWRARLNDLAVARRLAAPPTGNGVRPSYRTPPSPGPRRLFFETSSGQAPLELLASVKRGLFAAAPTAPVRIDLAADRFALEFTGVAIVAGRAQGPVAGARATGRLSELLHRIAAVATDRQFFPMPYPVGSPTLLVERASFD